MNEIAAQVKPGKKLRKIEIVGLILVVLSLLGLIFNPQFISGIF